VRRRDDWERLAVADLAIAMAGVAFEIRSPSLPNGA
jgi:hypothetical protein